MAKGRMTTGEGAFHDLMTAPGITLVPQPKTFKLPDLATTYRPDFYCVERDVYYEVISTPSCFRLNLDKYRAFRIAYPDLCLVIVAEDGQPYRDCPAVATFRGHGGRREGAGRKPMEDGEPMTRVCFTLPEEYVAKVERYRVAQGLPSFSAAIRAIIDLFP